MRVRSRAWHLPALAFDPFEDRRARMIYGRDGFLSKTMEPCEDPAREVAQTYVYHADGRLKEASQLLSSLVSRNRPRARPRPRLTSWRCWLCRS